MNNIVVLRIVNPIKNFLFQLQEYSLYTVDVVKGIPACYRYRNDVLREMYLIGAQSFGIIFLSGIFIGIILALEIGYRFETFGAKSLVGRTVTLGMIRELGPVISGLLLAARTGAKNASEIGAMKTSEQIDALRAYGTDPVQKLVIPRTIASVVMFLPLTLIADAIGIASGMTVSAWWLHVDYSFFWQSGIYALQLKDLFVGFAKPIFFGYFIASISCYFGLSTTGGTTGVGRSTINAVVYSCVALLFLDFLFTKVVWEIL